ncbi:MAG: hypothetical protein QXS32_08395 [Candidatus Nezhaarchaeales archaeon]
MTSKTFEEKARVVLESFKYGGLSRGTHIIVTVDERPIKVEKVE